MSVRFSALATTLLTMITAVQAAPSPPGDPAAGREFIMRSCVSCHAPDEATRAVDGAPSLSFIARDNKERPAFIRGWLMAPHSPMPEILLSRQQINDIIAYLETLAP